MRILVDHLKRISKPESPDRATLAHLRRGLVGAGDYSLLRAGWLFNSIDNDQLDMAIVVAGLFAQAKGKCPDLSGQSFGRAVGIMHMKQDRGSVEKRFIDLLDTDEVDLPYKLRQMVSLLAADGVGLDWARLGDDLVRWTHPERWTQKNWARDFWFRHGSGESPQAAAGAVGGTEAAAVSGD